MKVNKVYPAFYNGVTEQPPELCLDNQCKDMVNCVPDLVKGLHRRPPVTYVSEITSTYPNSKLFHTYDRGEDNEEYLMFQTGNTDNPLHIINRQGVTQSVVYSSEAVKPYLSGKLKGLTVQDRTWVINKDIKVTLDNTGQTALSANYDKVAYYWLKRGSGDKYNPYNYAVYLDGVTYACNPNKPGSDVPDPSTGFEDSDYAAAYLKNIIDASPNFNASVYGSIVVIWKNSYADFTFDCWDSWGNEASDGWKGKVNRLTDLPKDFPLTNTYVEITGDYSDNFTSYYVKWNGSSWEETRHPTEIRGKLSNMPIKIDRTSAGVFTVSQEDWALPKVGNLDNNPNPSFVDDKLVDIFFYKNRFGLASSSSVVLTEAANYINFYSKTALDVIDTDPVDLAIVSDRASSLHYVKPFNNSLFVFSGVNQFEVTSSGVFTPTTVSVEVVTTYPMAIDVEPVVMNSSLFFISTTGGKQQLREYIKNEKLTVEGVDLNIATPNYLSQPITKIVVNGVLGFVLCCTASNVIYVYNYKDNSGERMQSAWSKWVVLEGLDTIANSFNYSLIDCYLLILCKTATDHRYHSLDLTDIFSNNKIDTTKGSLIKPIISLVQLPDYYPHTDKMGTPKDKILLKKMQVQGTGTFDARVHRKDYNRSFLKLHTLDFKDLDMHISSKVGNVEIFIEDSSINDFSISSIILEGLYSPTSKEVR